LVQRDEVVARAVVRGLNKYISVPLFGGLGSAPHVRCHSVEDRSRYGEASRHSPSVTLVEGVDVPADCRDRIFRWSHLCTHVFSPVRMIHLAASRTYFVGFGIRFWEVGGPGGPALWTDYVQSGN